MRDLNYPTYGRGKDPEPAIASYMYNPNLFESKAIAIDIQNIKAQKRICFIIIRYHRKTKSGNTWT